MPHKHHNHTKNNIKIQTKQKPQLVVIKKNTQQQSTVKTHNNNKHIVHHHNKPYKYCDDENEYDSPEFPNKF